MLVHYDVVRSQGGEKKSDLIKINELGLAVIAKPRGVRLGTTKKPENKIE